MILCVLAQYALTGWSEWRRGDDGRSDFADEEKLGGAEPREMPRISFGVADSRWHILLLLLSTLLIGIGLLYSEYFRQNA
jgi:hypothetical protein